MFLQNLKCSCSSSDCSVSQDRVYELLLDIINHGCKGCGSVPVDFPNNDPSNGILTINYVNDRKGCQGVCGDGAVIIPFPVDALPDTTADIGTPPCKNLLKIFISSFNNAILTISIKFASVLLESGSSHFTYNM